MNKSTSWLFEIPLISQTTPDAVQSLYSNPEWTEQELERVLPAQSRAQVILPWRVRHSSATAYPPTATLQRTVDGWGQYKQQIQELPPNQQKILAELGEAIKRSFQPGYQSVRMVQIYGHADRDPRLEREQQMSRDRAQAVTDWLRNYVGGAIAAQIWWDMRGLGATQLKVPPITEENRRKNRRVEVRLYSIDKLHPSNPGLIEQVQSCLNKLMGARLTVNGRMGRETSFAIRSFQQRQRLAVNGTITPQTLSALINACPLAQIVLSGVPLISKESTPPDSTLYVAINLCATSSKAPICSTPLTAKTGIYIPPNYSAKNQVDLIVYLQGWHKHQPSSKKPLAPGYYPTTMTIDQYWNQSNYPFWNFREKVDSSGKNVILVAPTLGPGSEVGTLTQPGGFDAYIEQVITSLIAHGPYQGWKTRPVVGNIILACHSGGGIRMRQLVLSGSKYTANIRECWGFDCTYGGDAADLSKWAKANPSGKVYIYYIRQCLLQDPTQPKKKWKAAACPSSPSGCANPKAPITGGVECINTTREAITLASFKLPNVFVTASKTGDHNKVPITYWEDRIKAAPFLMPR